MMEVLYGENEEAARMAVEGQAPTFGAEPVQVNIPAPAFEPRSHETAQQVKRA